MNFTKKKGSAEKSGGKELVFCREKVNLNGSKQDIAVIYSDLSKPVLLILHGGPGSPDRALIKKYNLGLADSFTLVCWDQRASGYSNNRENRKAPLTISLMLSDLDILIDYLRAKLKKDKIYIAGHSFGSYLGVRYLQLHSEKIAGYIGTGQYVSDLKGKVAHFEFTCQSAEMRNDRKAVEYLKQEGCPVNRKYKGGKKADMHIRRLSQKYGSYCYNGKTLSPFIPQFLKEYKLHVFQLLGGILYSLGSQAEQEIAESEDVYNYSDFSVPVVIISGERDFICPITTAKEWFERINAPAKRFVEIPFAAHMVCFEQPERWNEAVKSILAFNQGPSSFQ